MASETIRPVTETALHAFVDGQLAAADIEQVSGWLRTHSDDAARVATWQAQRAQLQAMHRDVLDEPVPIALERALRPRRLAALLGVGWLGGWAVHDGSQATLVARAVPEFVHEARVAHVVYTPEKRHPVEVGVDQSKHLIEWLSRRLGAPLATPDLSAQGYRLMGGRLLPGEQGQSRAQFMYEQVSGERVTLHVSVCRKRSVCATDIGGTQTVTRCNDVANTMRCAARNVTSAGRQPLQLERSAPPVIRKAGGAGALEYLE